MAFLYHDTKYLTKLILPLISLNYKLIYIFIKTSWLLYITVQLCNCKHWMRVPVIPQNIFYNYMNRRKTKHLTSPLKQSFLATVWASDQSWFVSNTRTRSSFWRCLGCCRLGKLDFDTGRRPSRGLSSSGFRTSTASNHTSKNLL